MNKKIASILGSLRAFCHSFWKYKPFITIIVVFILICWGFDSCADSVTKSRDSQFMEEFGVPYPTNEVKRNDARHAVIHVLFQQKVVVEKERMSLGNFDKLIKDIPVADAADIENYLKAKEQMDAMTESEKRQTAFFQYLLHIAYKAGFEKETMIIGDYPGSSCGCE